MVENIRMQVNLPTSEYAFPGPLRDSLVAAILRGEKTTTTSLVHEYELLSEPLPRVGDRAVVIDSGGSPVCLEEIVDVRVVSLASVDLQHALDEGEGFTDVAHWRSVHETFWTSDDYRNAIQDPEFAVDDSTLVVLVRFMILPLPEEPIDEVAR